MGLLDRFGKPDPLTERARQLVPAANVVAISATKFADRLPGGFRTEDWDFFLTVAGAHTGVQSLHELVGGGVRFDHLHQIVRDEAAVWSGEARAALDDCRNFVTGTVNRLRAEGIENEHLVGDALGMWVVINVLQRHPRDEEMHAARPIGVLLVNSFASWWD